jgi:predicted nucleic acid-binding protein
MKAWELCKDVDEKDMMFVALALELDALLWTTDKKLATGLLAKGFDKFYLPF